MKVALGVSGGVAAYKAAELVRKLQERRIDVQVVMTRSACEFVTPLTFAALSGNRVITEMFGNNLGQGTLENAIEHIDVAQNIQALVIAPATADLISRVTHGLADDFLTTLALATPAPIIICPAMNVCMWKNPATCSNVRILRKRGVVVLDPDEGYLACGMKGEGRLASNSIIADQVFKTLNLKTDLKQETILVTAGPTCEDIDPARFLSNRSSGKMGYAIAEAASRRSASVTLITGPTSLTSPSGVKVKKVWSADEMENVVLNQLNDASVVIMAAAVGDYRPTNASSRKIKKTGNSLQLNLEPTTDILKSLSKKISKFQKRAIQKKTLLIGFAAETDNLIKNARSKLNSKSLDMIVANDILRPDSGFKADTNSATLIFPSGRPQVLGVMTKQDLSNRILNEIVKLRSKNQL